MKTHPMMMAARAVEQTASQPAQPGIMDKLQEWLYGSDFLETSGLGLVEYPSCVFTTGIRSDATKAIQQRLVEKGFTKLKVDGLWGNCTESAFRQMYGVELTKQSLEDKLGVRCGSFTKQIYGKCTDGSDSQDPQWGGIPVSVTPTPTRTVSTTTLNVATPEAARATIGQALTQIASRRRTTASITPATSISPSDTTTIVANDPQVLATPPESKLPKIAIAVGIVAVVAGGAYLYTRRK